MSIEQFEKAGRLLLWLVISIVLVISFAVVPLRWLKQNQAEDELRKSLDEMAKALKDKDQPKVARFSLKSMGTAMTGVNYSRGEGRLSFTNVSAHDGIVCVVGTITNATSKQATESLPACVPVGAYASVQIEMSFASNDLAAVCPNVSDCSLSVKDATDAVPVALQ